MKEGAASGSNADKKVEDGETAKVGQTIDVKAEEKSKV